MTLRTLRLQDTSMLPSHGLNALVLPLQRYTKEHFLEQQGKAILETVAAHINQAA